MGSRTNYATLVAAGTFAALLATGSTAQAGVIRTAASLPTGTAALTTATPPDTSMDLAYTNANVGNSFTASSAITITGLGLFSNGASATPFAGTAYATLFDLTTGTVVTQLSFSSTVSGTQLAGTSDYFQTLAVPVTLNTTDTYDIAGYYSSTADSFYDPGHFQGGGPNASPGATQDASGILTFVGTGLYSASAAPGTQNSAPTVADTGPAIRYGAATFTYTTAAAVPEPTSIALLAVGLGGVMMARRRAKRASI